jgi:hypothetical protein
MFAMRARRFSKAARDFIVGQVFNLRADLESALCVPSSPLDFVSPSPLAIVDFGAHLPRVEKLSALGGSKAFLDLGGNPGEIRDNDRFHRNPYAVEQLATQTAIHEACARPPPRRDFPPKSRGRGRCPGFSRIPFLGRPGLIIRTPAIAL